MLILHRPQIIPLDRPDRKLPHRQNASSAIISIHRLETLRGLTKSLCSPLTPTILNRILDPLRIDSPVCVEVNAGGFASG